MKNFLASPACCSRGCGAGGARGRRLIRTEVGVVRTVDLHPEVAAPADLRLQVLRSRATRAPIPSLEAAAARVLVRSFCSTKLERPASRAAGLGFRPGRPGRGQPRIAGDPLAAAVVAERRFPALGFRARPVAKASARSRASDPQLGLQGLHRLAVEVSQEEAGKDVAQHGQEQQDQGDRQHAEQEVGEGEAAAHLVEEGPVRLPEQPEQAEGHKPPSRTWAAGLT